MLWKERIFRLLYRAGELNQVLLTIGLVFVAAASAAYIFGTGQQPIQLPDYLRGLSQSTGQRFGAYRIFLIVVAIIIAGLLVFGLEHTRFGARVRAAVDNQRVAQGLGLNVDAIFAVTFALGSGLAGLGGALAIEIVGLDPSFGFHYLVYVLIVVAIGGLGSIGGSFLAAALLGIFDVARQISCSGDRVASSSTSSWWSFCSCALAAFSVGVRPWRRKRRPIRPPRRG